MIPTSLSLEMTVEPFVAGNPGRRVEVVMDKARAAGLEIDFGPFGTVLTGSSTAVLALLSDLVGAALAAGASRVSVQVAEHHG